MVYMKLDRLSEAKATFQEAITAASQSGVKATIYNMLGNICFKGLEFDLAVTYYQKGIEVYPINKTSFETSIANSLKQKKLHKNYNESLAFLKESKLVEAISILENIAKDEPNFKDVSHLLDSTLLKLEARKAAFDINRFYDHGLACIKSKDWKGAVEAFELVTVKSPNYKKVKSNLSLAQNNLKQKMKNDILKRYYDDGNNAVKQGDFMSAIISYERVAEINPNYKNIQYKIKQ